jgi:hypothetical protein
MSTNLLNLHFFTLLMNVFLKLFIIFAMYNLFTGLMPFYRYSLILFLRFGHCFSLFRANGGG